MSTEIYEQIFETATTPETLGGVVVGVVTNVNDPEHIGRVKLKLPLLDEATETGWARVVGAGAGRSRGLYLPLEVGDEVLVAFAHDSAQQPYVIGALWSGEDPPPEHDAQGHNNLRVLRSRSGHLVRLDDTQGAEKIEIIDSSGENSVVLNAVNGTLTIRSRGDLVLESGQGNVTLSGNQVSLQSRTAMSLQAGTELQAKGSTQLTLTAAMVKIN